MKRINKSTLTIAAEIFFLLFIAIYFCAPVLRSGDKLGTSDWDQLLSLQEVPRKTIMEFCQFPLCNPYSCGGMSLIGNPQARSFSPATIYSLVFGSMYGLKLEICAHLFIGLLGMYLLLRQLGVRGVIALIPSVIFMLNSKYALHLSEGHTFWLTIAYLPFVLLFYLKSQRERKFVFAAALFIALMIFEGGTYIVVSTMLFLSCYSLLQAIQQKKMRPLIDLVLISILAVLFSGPKLLPLMELKMMYPRYIDCDDFIPFHHIDEVFLHDVHELDGRQFMSKYYWHEYGANLGLIPLIIFCLSAVLLLKRCWPLVVAGILFFFLGLGNFAVCSPWNILQKLPVFNFMRVPSRFLIYFIFSFSILSGLLLERFARLPRLPRVVRLAVVFSLLAFITYDLTKVNRIILKRSFRIENVYPTEPGEFRQKRQGALYGAYSAMYPDLVRNRGVIDGYEPMPIEIKALPSGHDDYRGEFYLLSGNGRASLSSWSPNKIVIDVRADSDCVLVINQNYDINWKTNSRYPAVSADGLLSVRVTPADGEVVLYYLPNSFLLGLGFLLLGLLLFLFRRRIPFFR